MTNWSSRFRRAATRGELRVPVCPNCRQAIWHPRSVCPRCLETNLESTVLTGAGTLRSWGVVHRSQVENLQADTPFAIGLIELDEGPLMIARTSDDLRTGDRVGVTFREIGGRWLPTFVAWSKSG